MNYYTEKQQSNREKANKAFNEFMECFLEADSNFKGKILLH